MAIIYTYPVKTTPVDADLVLISDSADNNNTKQVTISSIKSLTAGVTSVAATLPLVASAATCLLYTSPSPRDRQKYRMPSSA